jgi:hypothetical protein
MGDHSDCPSWAWLLSLAQSLSEDDLSWPSVTIGSLSPSTPLGWPVGAAESLFSAEDKRFFPQIVVVTAGQDMSPCSSATRLATQDSGAADCFPARSLAPRKKVGYHLQLSLGRGLRVDHKQHWIQPQRRLQRLGQNTKFEIPRIHGLLVCGTRHSL